jgi:GT2 family glycosyltransferase
MIGELRRPGGAEVAFSRLRFIDPQRKFDRKQRWYEAGLADYAAGQPLWLALMFCNFFFSTSNLIARRDKFLEVGGLGPFRYCHDLDYILKAIFVGHKVQFVDQSLCEYRFHCRNTIDEDMRAVLFEEMDVLRALSSLMTRDPKPERE